MDSTITEEDRLRRLVKRLRWVAIINIGLWAALVAFTMVAFGLVHNAAADLEDSEQPMSVFTWLIPWLLRLNIVCLALLLVWGPALVICGYKLKKLKRERGEEKG